MHIHVQFDDETIVVLGTNHEPLAEYFRSGGEELADDIDAALATVGLERGSPISEELITGAELDRLTLTANRAT